MDLKSASDKTQPEIYLTLTLPEVSVRLKERVGNLLKKALSDFWGMKLHAVTMPELLDKAGNRTGQLCMIYIAFRVPGGHRCEKFEGIQEWWDDISRDFSNEIAMIAQQNNLHINLQLVRLFSSHGRPLSIFYDDAPIYFDSNIIKQDERSMRKQVMKIMSDSTES